MDLAKSWVPVEGAMPSELSSDSKFEIGHVLFLDLRRLLQAPDRRTEVSGCASFTEIVLGTAQV